MSLPLNYGSGSRAMLWQAQSGMYFRLDDGYLAVAPTSFVNWPIVLAGLQNVYLADMSERFVAYAVSRGASAVIVPDWGRPPRSWAAIRTRAIVKGLGAPTVEAGGVSLYRLGPQASAKFRSVTAEQMVMKEVGSRFGALLRASSEYLAQGGDPSKLNLATAARARLIPRWWTSADTRASNFGVLLEPQDDGRVAVGIKCYYLQFAPLVKKYGGFAKSMYFPYPEPLEFPRAQWLGWQFFAMAFDREGLARAAAAAAVNEAARPAAAESFGTSDRQDWLASAP